MSMGVGWRLYFLAFIFAALMAILYIQDHSALSSRKRWIFSVHGPEHILHDFLTVPLIADHLAHDGKHAVTVLIVEVEERFWLLILQLLY